MAARGAAGTEIADNVYCRHYSTLLNRIAGLKFSPQYSLVNSRSIIFEM